MEPPEPQEDYANYSPEQSEEESSVGHSKNGHSIADSLRHALEQRNRVNQSQQRQGTNWTVTQQTHLNTLQI